MSPTADRRPWLADARRSIARFEPANAQQRQLAALSKVLLDHLEQDFCGRSQPPAGGRSFEEWVAIFTEYRRALFSPALAGRQARAVLADLLDPRRRQRLSPAGRRSRSRTDRKGANRCL